MTPKELKQRREDRAKKQKEIADEEQQKWEQAVMRTVLEPYQNSGKWWLKIDPETPLAGYHRPGFAE